MELSQSKLSILVVDDCEDACETLGFVIALKFPDVTIFKANNGKTGLELFRKYTPHIVITDIDMPEMNGIQMATEIKAVRNDAHIIVLTANNDEEFHEKISAVGCSEFMVKPVIFHRLFAAIGKCIG